MEVTQASHPWWIGTLGTREALSLPYSRLAPNCDRSPRVPLRPCCGSPE